MSSAAVLAAVEPRLQRLFAWFDPEAAAVVTILLGLVQVILCVPLAHADHTLPKFFILPLILGIVIMAAGSFTIANEKNTSRLLLRGCAYSHAVGLLGALLAFCLYCYSLSLENQTKMCEPGSVSTDYHYRRTHYLCLEDLLEAYRWSLILLLLLFDIGAVVLHCLLSVSALKTLKTN
ncbi:uncharacterized protein LOC141763925 [Sebastes fasciatus]|uniref:uncharacterized protein LOC141763925 n=1 Tax=Sebastes fasciatus TaxID=394691 RepID=UPI003D9DF667